MAFSTTWNKGGNQSCTVAKDFINLHPEACSSTETDALLRECFSLTQYTFCCGICTEGADVAVLYNETLFLSTVIASGDVKEPLTIATVYKDT